MSKTEYERYIRTDELLALQKPAEALVNPDELLFQVTHQAAELWMKVIAHDLSRIEKLMLAEKPLPAGHLLRRCAQIVALLAQQVTILETMPQSDYHVIRTALGRGSGQESPGFNYLLT